MIFEYQKMTKMTNSTRKSGSTFAITGIKRSTSAENSSKSKIIVKKFEKIFKKLNPTSRKQNIEDKLEAQQSRIAELEAEVKRLNQQNRQTNKRIFEQNAPKSTSKLRSSQADLEKLISGPANRRVSAEFSRNIKIQRRCDFTQSTSRINHEQVAIKGLEMGWQPARNVQVGYGMTTHPPRRLNSSVVRRSPIRRESELNFSILL